MKSAFACEPCQKTLNLIETIQKADVIIEGQKISEGPRSEVLNPDYAKPEWIEIGVLDTLKGNPAEASVKVNSWDGMCPYGIVVDDRTYVFFLVKREVNDEEYAYDAVDFGCAQKTLIVENNAVNFHGSQVSLDDFVKIVASKD